MVIVPPLSRSVPQNMVLYAKISYILHAASCDSFSYFVSKLYNTRYYKIQGIQRLKHRIQQLFCSTLHIRDEQTKRNVRTHMVQTLFLNSCTNGLSD